MSASLSTSQTSLKHSHHTTISSTNPIAKKLHTAAPDSTPNKLSDSTSHAELLKLHLSQKEQGDLFLEVPSIESFSNLATKQPASAAADALTGDDLRLSQLLQNSSSATTTTESDHDIWNYIITPEEKLLFHQFAESNEQDSSLRSQHHSLLHQFSALMKEPLPDLALEEELHNQMTDTSSEEPRTTQTQKNRAELLKKIDQIENNLDSVAKGWFLNARPNDTIIPDELPQQDENEDSPDAYNDEFSELDRALGEMNQSTNISAASTLASQFSKKEKESHPLLDEEELNSSEPTTHEENTKVSKQDESTEEESSSGAVFQEEYPEDVISVQEKEFSLSDQLQDSKKMEADASRTRDVPELIKSLSSSSENTSEEALHERMRLLSMITSNNPEDTEESNSSVSPSDAASFGESNKLNDSERQDVETYLNEIESTVELTSEKDLLFVGQVSAPIDQQEDSDDFTSPFAATESKSEAFLKDDGSEYIRVRGEESEEMMKDEE